MRRLCVCFPIFFAVLLPAAEPAWKSKPVSRWTADDAKEVLAGSPWAKPTALAILPERGEDQLREGGRMGGGGQRAGMGPIDKDVVSGARKEVVDVRWESAAPVRAAEVLAGETAAPSWEGEFIAIAVYDVPGVTPSSSRMLRATLKQVTVLKCAGRKDLKPERVELALRAGNRATILCLFPRSPEFAADDRRIEFVTQIGRVQVDQHFATGEMWFQGKLEL
jgi:hypothetical protein